MFRHGSLYVAFLVFAFATGQVCRAADAPPPNVLLIVSDDQGYRDLGCFGSTEIETPNLDRLAAGGVRLTDFYVTWPACTPSRGSLLTGRYPQRNGVCDMIRNEAPDHGYKYSPAEYEVTFERIGGMDTREVLLPAVLRQAGYTSGIFGKWDLGSLRRFLPQARGFDHFYGLVNTGIDYFTHERYGVPSMYRDNQPTTEDKGTYCTYLFQREAVRFLKANNDRPFFLYVPFNAPHGASSLDPAIRGAAQAPDKYKNMYPHLKDELVSGRRYGKEALVPSRNKRRLEYVASITCMDEAIGELLDLLDEFELSENTIVIFFSDNGGGSVADNGPLRGGKSQMFEGGIRVPCIVRWPAHIPKGRECAEFLTSLEIFPTIAAAAGVKPSKQITLDGFDMLPVLQGKQPSVRKEMFWKRQADRAARVGNWKWVDSARGSGLFDLSQDVAEKRDLSEQRPEVLKKVQARFAAWRKLMDQAEPRGPFKDF